jgi:hypothetical protein
VGGDGRDADGSLLLLLRRRRLDRCRGGDAEAEAEPEAEPETVVGVLLPIPRINRHLHRWLLSELGFPSPGKPGGAFAASLAEKETVDDGSIALGAVCVCGNEEGGGVERVLLLKSTTGERSSVE